MKSLYKSGQTIETHHWDSPNEPRHRKGLTIETNHRDSLLRLIIETGLQPPDSVEPRTCFSTFLSFGTHSGSTAILLKPIKDAHTWKLDFPTIRFALLCAAFKSTAWFNSEDQNFLEKQPSGHLVDTYSVNVPTLLMYICLFIEEPSKFKHTQSF